MSNATTDTRTVRKVVAGVWICAAIVMVTSVADAFLAFGSYGGNRGIGLGLGVSVDLALCVGLVGDRWLATHGRRSQWGRPLRVVTFLISLILNTASAIHDGHYFLALLLGCLPVVLWCLTEYGNDLWMQAAEIAKAAQPAPVPTPAPVATPQPAAPVASHPVVIPRPPAVPNPLGNAALVIPPAVRPVPPAPQPTARPVTPPSKPRQAPRTNGEVSPELLAQASRWVAIRTRDKEPTGRRSMIQPPAEGGLGISEPLARKVIAALNRNGQLQESA